MSRMVKVREEHIQGKLVFETSLHYDSGRYSLVGVYKEIDGNCETFQPFRDLARVTLETTPRWSPKRFAFWQAPENHENNAQALKARIEAQRAEASLREQRRA